MKILKDFYGAHPIRRTLITIVVITLAALAVWFRPAFDLKAAHVPETNIPHAARGEEIPVGERSPWPRRTDERWHWTPKN